jgi:hypothetical protein
MWIKLLDAVNLMRIPKFVQESGDGSRVILSRLD